MPQGERNKFVYDTSSDTGKPLGTRPWYDGTQQPVLRDAMAAGDEPFKVVGAVAGG